MSRKQTSAAFCRAMGAAIRTERLRLGWSQEQLADIAELSRAYVTELEGGRRTPNLGTLLRVATAFNMKVSKLVAAAEGQLPRST